MTTVIKDSPCAGDVHVNVPMGNGKKPNGFKAAWAAFRGKKQMTKGNGMSIQAQIFKVDEDTHTVTGWASVIEKDGKPVVDHQGDIIDESTLVKAAHGFMTNHRIGKAMHEGDTVSDAVESMVFTKDLQKALGIDLGMVGWLVKFKLNDDAVWKRVQSGELRSFSIGGKAERQAMEE